MSTTMEKIKMSPKIKTIEANIEPSPFSLYYQNGDEFDNFNLGREIYNNTHNYQRFTTLLFFKGIHQNDNGNRPIFEYISKKKTLKM